MAFSPETVADLLVKANRHCCLCRLFKGKNIELHHIISQAEGGGDDPDNGIPLCFDCHADVTSYNPSHPRGRKYTPSELKRHRDEWYAIVASMTERKPEPISAQPHTGMDSGTSPQGGRIKIIGNNNITAVGDININTRTVRRVAFTPGPQHITEAQAHKIGEIIKELVEIDKTSSHPSKNAYRDLYGKLNRRFSVNTFRAISAERGEEAVAWLLKQKAMQRPRLRRANNEAWRNSLYAAIWARARELGLTKQDVYNIANERLNLKVLIGSLKDLGERNLKSLHNIIFGMR